MAKYKPLPAVYKLNGEEIDPEKFFKMFAEKLQKEASNKKELKEDGGKHNQD